MGIKGLRAFLKKKEVDCFYTIPLYSFHGKRMAIDSLNWVFCYLGNSFQSILAKKKRHIRIYYTRRNLRCIGERFFKF